MLVGQSRVVRVIFSYNIRNSIDLGNIFQILSVRWIQEMCHAHEKSNAIVDIERKLQYQFENKNYLMAVFMPYPSYEFTEGVNYQK